MAEECRSVCMYVKLCVQDNHARGIFLLPACLMPALLTSMLLPFPTHVFSCWLISKVLPGSQISAAICLLLSDKNTQAYRPKALHLFLRDCMLQGISAQSRLSGSTRASQLPVLIISLGSELQKYCSFVGCKFRLACMENNIYRWFNWALQEIWIILK